MVDAAAQLPIMKELAEGTPDLIDTQSQLDTAIKRLSGSDEPVAVDTERAQGFRYGPEAWLVQIRRRDVGTFLVDANALPNLGELSNVLNSPWIFHSAGQDLPSLAELGMVPDRIFDTEVAARLVGVQHFSLQGTCEELLGYTLEKAHQNENWSVRPLPNAWLRYAAMDVEVLPDLQDALHKKLKELGRTEWAGQEFEHARTHPIQAKTPRWENLKGVGKLRTPAQLAIARELWEVRERIAKSLDISPGRLLNGRGILEAAQKNPQTKRALSSIEFFRRPKARQYADEWWAALRRAQTLTTDEMPTRDALQVGNGLPPLRAWKRTRPAAVDRLQAIRALVEGAAAPLSISSEVLLLPATQRAIAWNPLRAGSSPSLIDQLDQRFIQGEVRPWQAELLLDAADQQRDLLDRLTRGD